MRHIALVVPVLFDAVAAWIGEGRRIAAVALAWAVVALVHVASIVLFIDRGEMNWETRTVSASWTGYYGLPDDWETLLPAGAVLANHIGETHNFPLAGRGGQYRVVLWDNRVARTLIGMRACGAKYAVTMDRVPNLDIDGLAGLRLAGSFRCATGFRWWGYDPPAPVFLRVWALPDAPPLARSGE
jgi:hypothetical protein